MQISLVMQIKRRSISGYIFVLEKSYNAIENQLLRKKQPYQYSNLIE